MTEEYRWPVAVSVVPITTVREKLIMYRKPDGEFPTERLAEGQTISSMAALALDSVGLRVNSSLRQLSAEALPENGPIVRVPHYALFLYKDIDSISEKGNLIKHIIPHVAIEAELDNPLSPSEQLMRKAMKALISDLCGNDHCELLSFVLPEQFTLASAQYAYEAIVGRRVNRTTFRRKLVGVEPPVVVPTGELENEEVGRRRALFYRLNPVLGSH